MKTRKTIVELTPMTAEDKALVEALVDGELCDSERRELLVRLDKIDGGWKFCAVSFLESQCFRETFDAFVGDWEAFFTESPRTASNVGAFSASRPEIAEKVGPDLDFFERTRFANETIIPNATKNSKEPQNSIDSLCEQASRRETSASIGAFFAGNAALCRDDFIESADFAQDFDFYEAFCANEDSQNAGSFRREETEPRIIPLKRGGYRNEYRNSSRRGGSGGGDGPTWRSRLASTAGGFLLAFALGGVFYSQFVAPTSSKIRSGGAVSTLTNASSQTSQNLQLAQNSHSTSIAPSTQSESAAQNVETISEFADFDGNSEAPFRVVTLKSPQRRLDDVAVPCFVADDPNAAAFRNAKIDVPPQIVEQVRKTGGRIIATRDEYRFRLNDNRILIIPVDAYDIQYEDYQNAQ